ncbi:MAG: hypothetical protein ACKPKO_05665 [Candidatus Fonsibacter sp.]
MMVYISNEAVDEIINFTKEDLTYICKQAFTLENPKRLKDISHTQ